MQFGKWTILLKRSEIRPAELFVFKVSLILMTSTSEFIFACFYLNISPRN